MDSAWPSDNRTEQPPERFIKTISAREYPLVNQGLNNTISLIERDGRLKWDFLVRNDPDAEGSTLRVTEPQTLFPSSRSAPLKPPRITTKERAEQGANFLRTFLPDIEITAELIREQIIEDEGYLKKLREFDPFSGTLLASLTPRTTSSSPTALLCYVMGELNTDLNISPFTVSDSGSFNFNPKATASHTFNTPIQQITTSSPANPFEANQDSFLAVRTYGPTFFFRLSSVTDLRQISTLGSSDTDERSMMDVKLDGSSRRASVVNERGSLYRWSLTENKVVNSWKQPEDSAPDDFWRIGLTQDASTCLLASSKNLRLSQGSIPLFDLQAQIQSEVKESLVASLQDMKGSQICFVTTSDILWLDERFPKRPLLGIHHGRARDRTLSAHTVPFADRSVTLLCSRKHSLVSAYDVTQVGDHRLQLSCLPHCCKCDRKLKSTATGQTILSLPTQGNNAHPLLIWLTETGSLNQVSLHYGKDEPVEFPEVVVDWSDEVQALEARASSLRTDFGPMGPMERTQMDFRPAYETIFQDHYLGSSEGPDPSKTQKVLNNMKSFWKQPHEGSDHVLTTYDIAYRSAESETPPSARADFLSPSIITPSSSFSALRSGSFPIQSLANDLKWHFNLANTFDRMGIETMSDTPLDARFSQFDLLPDAARTEHAVEMEKEARQQLALDLSLGSDIFLPQPLANVDTELDTMSRATGALSLAGEPPLVEYAFLKPIPRARARGRKAEDGDNSASLGTRLLLDDWTLGSSPSKYTYEDPYTDSNVQSPPRVPIQKTAENPHNNSNVAPQRPPVVITARSVVPTIKTRTEEPLRRQALDRGFSQAIPSVQGSNSASQPLGGGSFKAGSFSQEGGFASTQVMPGPYGGRPSAVKKPAKKRLGGF